MSEANSREATPWVRRFVEQELPLPPIPADLEARLTERADWIFSTREDTPGPYSIDWFVEEFVRGPQPEDYLIFGVDGHGVNSYAMHYLLVRGPLAVFEQIAYGGVYTDNAAAASMMEIYWAQTSAMIRLLDEARASGGMGPDERLVIVLSDFYGSRWTKVPRYGAYPPEEWAWTREPNGLQGLLSAVLAAHEYRDASAT